MQAFEFQQRILHWYAQFGRRDLPWQQQQTPYRVWVSEIMLQQTQVSTVVPYFNRFITRLPDVTALASAPEDTVLSLWAGLGYYARARNLHNAAKQIAIQGKFPDNLTDWMKLPGVGRSTAGAILSIALQQRQPILDGNVKRVLARFRAITGWPGNSKVNKQLWAISDYFTPEVRVADYTQAIMDLGATLCTRSNPDCFHCPVTIACMARKRDLTAELPTPKPPVKLPIKQRLFAVLHRSDGAVLLQKRPTSGIWGGLWSFPDFPDPESLQNWLLVKNIAPQERRKLAASRHTFSHFHLAYTPILLRIQSPINFVMEAERSVWYKAEQQNDIALPAPVQKLLNTLKF